MHLSFLATFVLDLLVTHGTPLAVSKTTRHARESSAVHFTAYFSQGSSNIIRVKMKNKKYRSFLITPAFVEARKRKIENDSSYRRVLPPSNWRWLESDAASEWPKNDGDKHQTSEKERATSAGRSESNLREAMSANMVKHQSPGSVCRFLQQLFFALLYIQLL